MWLEHPMTGDEQSDADQEESESEESPDPSKIFDIQHIQETLQPSWDALVNKDQAWWRSFKQLVKDYILTTHFYDTFPPLHTKTELVTTKLEKLIPAACSVDQLSSALKETYSDTAKLEERKGMEPYSDGWVELVVLKFLAEEVGNAAT